jgi:hypothetical protein
VPSVAASRLAPTAATPAAVTGRVEGRVAGGPVTDSRSGSPSGPPRTSHTCRSSTVTRSACQRRGYRGTVRLTHFRALMDEEFGPVRAASLARDHVFAALGGRTVEGALEAGVDPRDVWRAVCEAYDVPAQRR